MFTKPLAAAAYGPLVLTILARGEAYGYAIIRRVGEVTGDRLQLTAGTLYPLLHSLEADGLVEATWRTSDAGRDRKYYRLTPAGKAALAGEQAQWQAMHSILTDLWGLAPAS